MIPDERWSDHPSNNGGGPDLGLGPDWVATIVDAIGESATKSGGVCDYWGMDQQAQRIERTVVFITWDDWGGFYDHVPPPAVYLSGYYDPVKQMWICRTQDAPSGWGCGYVYGFRVPLLVVSQWTPAGYVSGNTVTQGEQPEWEHDFGSILAFTEYNFTNRPGGPYNLPYISQPVYADFNTLDKTYQQQAVVPLWDFFLAPTARNFNPISPIDPSHTATFFQSYYQTPQNGSNPTPLGPEEISPGVIDPMD